MEAPISPEVVRHVEARGLREVTPEAVWGRGRVADWGRIIRWVEREGEQVRALRA